MDAQTYKDEGNKAFQQKRYEDSINFYTKAIELSPNDHVLYSNRSGSYASLKQYQNALNDAQKCVSLKSDWAKGYQRLGLAHFYLNQFEDSLKAYDKGLQIDPSNAQLQQGKQRAEEVLSSEQGSAAPGGDDVGGLFGSEMGQQVFMALLQNPETAAYLSDPEFMKNLMACAKNPMLFLTLGQKDPRLAKAFQIVTGQNFDFANPTVPDPSQIFKDKPSSSSASSHSSCNHDHDHDLHHGHSHSHHHQEKKEEQPAPPPAEPLDEADIIKNEGNAHYKKQDFQKALECYEKAITLKPNEVLFYNNQAAVFIEQGKLEDALNECNRAIKIIEDGEHVIKFENKAQVYARIGSIYFQQDKLQEAQAWLSKSIIENQDYKVKEELKKVQKLIQDQKEKEYENPALAEEANARAKDLFTAGQFPEALKEYEEAVQRNPSEAKYHFNIGMCRTKLLDWHNALKAFEKCVEKDANYAKVYPKKGNVHMMLKQYSQAIQTYSKGLKLDPTNTECISGMTKAENYIFNGPPDETQEDRQKRVEHNMKDPEIQEIMRIPEVMNALKSISGPEEAQQIMTDPFLGPQIQQLIMAGIVQVK